MSSGSYRCASCSDQSARCIACKARRNAARERLRAARKQAGLCTECGAKAYRLDGRRLTLCRAHALDLSARSSAAHKRARAEVAP